MQRVTDTVDKFLLASAEQILMFASKKVTEAKKKKKRAYGNDMLMLKLLIGYAMIFVAGETFHF